MTKAHLQNEGELKTVFSTREKGQVVENLEQMSDNLCNIQMYKLLYTCTGHLVMRIGIFKYD